MTPSESISLASEGKAGRSAARLAVCQRRQGRLRLSAENDKNGGHPEKNSSKGDPPSRGRIPVPRLFWQVVGLQPQRSVPGGPVALMISDESLAGLDD